MINVVYIHGAFATPICFNRLIEKLPVHHSFCPQYSVEIPLKDNIARIKEEIEKQFEPVTLIGHSLGGVIAMHVAHNNPNVKRVVTISSPFGGSKTADMMKWFNGQNIFLDISTSSPLIKSLLKQNIQCPILPIVTTAGSNPMMGEPNDGVVSIDSQMILPNLPYCKMPFSHLEILMTDELIDIIQDSVF